MDHEISGSMDELHGKLLEILRGLQDEIGVTHHPYKRAKRASGAKIDLGDFWHVKNCKKSWCYPVMSFSMHYEVSVSNQISDLT